MAESGQGYGSWETSQAEACSGPGYVAPVALIISGIRSREGVPHDVDDLVRGIDVVQRRCRLIGDADDPPPGGVIGRPRDDQRVAGRSPDPQERTLLVGCDRVGEFRERSDERSLDVSALEPVTEGVGDIVGEEHGVPFQQP
ncbi:hypothetical protein [Brachybacterium vulturis]|uniref:hypothetical protein n=1 Tax=Brachybacterium vulturis TaxID=2017484 RepID=UPI0012FE22A2|nr:hypothetical protein [Brachybacterium vulturis]